MPGFDKVDADHLSGYQFGPYDRCETIYKERRHPASHHVAVAVVQSRAESHKRLAGGLCELRVCFLVFVSHFFISV